MAVAVGDKAPEVTLRDGARNEVKLEQFAGRPVVLAFYALAFTGG
jgi:peroxiredoxin